MRLRALLAIAAGMMPLTLAGQSAPPPGLEQLATRLAALTAVSGYEAQALDTLLPLIPGATRDRVGNVVRVQGEGEPRRLVACPIDEPGFVVGSIRPDGYLTLRRVGPSPGPLADQQLEGQRVTVFGRRGPVPGVVGVRSVHLTRGRSAGDTPFTFDNAFVDVGADSAGEVARLGIEVLSPVAREKAPIRYGDTLLAAPVSGRRAACAALVGALADARPARGTLVAAFVVEQSFTRRGLLYLARSLGPFDQAVLLDARGGADTASHLPSPDPTYLPDLERWGLPVRYPATPVETVSLAGAERLERRLQSWIGGQP
ncbi:MAG TPA: hypothetical protein VMG41_06575 [Gemmatimonadales bacterium]|nr:hypothetical protein [Gemmatimonadales bacterium]